MRKAKVLCVIPARAGSKRIPSKNVKKFAGKPLISYSIEQANNLGFVDRVIVDTDSPKIAKIAKTYGAEVPFLRPARLATDTAKIADSVLHLLARLKKEEGYTPDYILLLQTTSPLREIKDIEACWRVMQEGDATAVLTISHTHPQLFYVEKGWLKPATSASKKLNNMQGMRDAYLLNGCFAYVIRPKDLKKFGMFMTSKTKAVLCHRWRSVDLDTPEDWVIGELLYHNRAKIERALKNF